MPAARRRPCGQGMPEPTELHAADEADLVALADDCLRPCRRAELEARVAADPTLARALADQRRALARLATAHPPCPTAALRARLAAHRHPVKRSAAPPRATRLADLAAGAPRLGAAAAAVATAAVVLATALGPPQTGDEPGPRRAAAEPSPGATGGAWLLAAAPTSFAGSHFVELRADGAAGAARLRAARPGDEVAPGVGSDGGPPAAGPSPDRAGPGHP